MSAELPIERISPGPVKRDSLCEWHTSEIRELKDRTEDIPLLAQKLDALIVDMGIVKNLLDNKYVTRERFNDVVLPLQKAVYAAISIICLGVLGAILGLVLVKR